MITREDIDKLSTLARIKITDGEKESVRADIENILQYVKVVNNFHADKAGAGVDTTIHNVMRDDVVTTQSGEYTESLLDAAPMREGDYLKVKKILQ